MTEYLKMKQPFKLGKIWVEELMEKINQRIFGIPLLKFKQQSLLFVERLVPRWLGQCRLWKYSIPWQRDQGFVSIQVVSVMSKNPGWKWWKWPKPNDVWSYQYREFLRKLDAILQLSHSVCHSCCWVGAIHSWVGALKCFQFWLPLVWTLSLCCIVICHVLIFFFMFSFD